MADRHLDLERPLSRRYAREQTTLAEMRALERLSRPALMARVTADNGLREETLVCVARGLLAAGDRDSALTALEALIDRTSTWIAKNLDLRGILQDADREDAAADIYRLLVEKVLDLSPEAEFWECRFWTCFDRRAQESLNRRLRASREVSTSIDADDGTTIDRLEECWAHDGPGVEEIAIARSALALLTEHQRTVFILKHVYRLPEESSDSAEPTIARAIGKTGRTVRNYLRDAERTLAQWRTEQAET